MKIKKDRLVQIIKEEIEKHWERSDVDPDQLSSDDQLPTREPDDTSLSELSFRAFQPEFLEFLEKNNIELTYEKITEFLRGLGLSEDAVRRMSLMSAQRFEESRKDKRFARMKGKKWDKKKPVTGGGSAEGSSAPEPSNDSNNIDGK